MSLSKKIRFGVFKRDNFCCGYCGSHPPGVVLEVDHIQALSNGGTDDLNNLITSCFGCNRGKKDIALSNIPPTLSENMERMLEKKAQLAAYNREVKKSIQKKRREISAVESVFVSHFPKRMFTESFRTVSVARFLQSISVEMLKEFMEIACLRFLRAPSSAVLYFCGICWKEIKGLR